MDKVSLILNVNGQEHHISVPVAETLLHALREELGLVGAREGCGIGMCGACTVLVEGRPISSCLMLAVQADGKEILTIEGLADSAKLHPVQQAYLNHAAFQCAYCTPGFILSTLALLDENSSPDDEEIAEYLAGNLCRCGSYDNILAAVRAAAGSLRAE